MLRMLPLSGPSDGDRDTTRRVGRVWIAVLVRYPRSESVPPDAVRSVEPIRVTPATGRRCGLDRSECPPPAAVVELQLDELPARRQVATEDPSLEGDGLAVDHAPPTRVNRALGEDAHRHVAGLRPDLRRTHVSEGDN